MTYFLITLAVLLVGAVVFVSIKYGGSRKEAQRAKADAADMARDSEISAGPFVDDPTDSMCAKK